MTSKASTKMLLYKLQMQKKGIKNKEQYIYKKLLTRLPNVNK